MKPQAILILSLVANLSLGATAYHFLRAKNSTPTQNAVSSRMENATQQNSPEESVKTNETIVVTNTVDEVITWQQIDSEDYKEFIANLRAIGCPEETIRDIIVAEVNRLYRTKMNAFFDISEESKYWKTQRQDKAARERQKKMQALEKEKSELLVELLGVDPTKERMKELGMNNYWEQRLSFLSEEKQEQIRGIREEFVEQRQAIYRDGVYDAEDWRKLRQIEKNEFAQLASVLTPEELQQYQSRFSHTANQLRSDLDEFMPTEQEFQAIFRLREARADDLIHSNDRDDKQTRETRDKALKEIDAQIKAQLGDTRFAEYERAKDWNYKQLARLTDRLELPKERAAVVYDVKKVAEDKVKQIHADKSLTQQQRTEALQAVRELTEQEVTTALGGEKNLKRYKSSGGWWISNLAPSMPSKTK